MDLTTRRFAARAAATFLFFAYFGPRTLSAGDLRAAFIEAGYIKPVGWSAGGSLFLSKDDVKNSVEGGSGLIVGGRVGVGGVEAWGGMAVLSNVGGGDIRAVITRTWRHPGGDSPGATYVGGEIGWGMGFRVSVGYARRVGGSSAAASGVVTWGVGLDFPKWRRPDRDTFTSSSRGDRGNRSRSATSG